MKTKQHLPRAQAGLTTMNNGHFTNRNKLASKTIGIWRIRFSIYFVMALLTCQIGSAAVVLLNPAADSFIQATNTATQNSNFGNSASLLAENTAVPGNARKSYIRFDLSGSAANGLIDSADLKLTLTLNQATVATPSLVVAVYGLNSAAAGQDWVEGAGQTGVAGATPPNPITWNNAPQNATTSGSGLSSQTTLLGTFTVTFGTAVGTSIDFSNAALATFLDNAGQSATLILVGQTSAALAVGFASKEDTAAGHAIPLLTLDVVPEPSTAAMSCFGLIFAGIFIARHSNRKKDVK